MSRTTNSKLVFAVRAKLARSVSFKRKSESRLMKCLNFLLNFVSAFVRTVTFGKVTMYSKNEFMTRFRTTIGNSVYLLDSDFDSAADFASEGVQIHELVHVSQKASDRFHSLKYLLSFRSRYAKEMEAYKVQLAVALIYKQRRYCLDFINEISEWLNGPKYFWAHSSKIETCHELAVFLAKVQGWLDGSGVLPGDSDRANRFVRVISEEVRLQELEKMMVNTNA